MRFWPVVCLLLGLNVAGVRAADCAHPETGGVGCGLTGQPGASCVTGPPPHVTVQIHAVPTPEKQCYGDWLCPCGHHAGALPPRGILVQSMAAVYPSYVYPTAGAQIQFPGTLVTSGLAPPTTPGRGAPERRDACAPASAGCGGQAPAAGSSNASSAGDTAVDARLNELTGNVGELQRRIDNLTRALETQVDLLRKFQESRPR